MLNKLKIDSFGYNGSQYVDYVYTDTKPSDSMHGTQDIYVTAYYYSEDPVKKAQKIYEHNTGLKWDDLNNDTKIKFIDIAKIILRKKILKNNV
jgi:hypothetical protein